MALDLHRISPLFSITDPPMMLDNPAMSVSSFIITLRLPRHRGRIVNVPLPVMPAPLDVVVRPADTPGHIAADVVTGVPAIGVEHAVGHAAIHVKSPKFIIGGGPIQ